MRAKKAKALKKEIYGDNVTTRKGRKYSYVNLSDAQKAALERGEHPTFAQIVADDKRRAYKALKRAAA